ncbi:MAG: hypothetical protein H3C31_02805 [Brumimicrobium sp.]|nr:hypothetical protein [Brumimicrobium sp.]
MSTPSMKYHDLPSLKTLIAYKNGLLSESERNWVESMLQHNAMVRAVAENATDISESSVATISQRTGKLVAIQYGLKSGFWSSYGVWIGLSSIILILGLFFFFNQFREKANYQPIELSVNFQPFTEKSLENEQEIPSVIVNKSPETNYKEIKEKYAHDSKQIDAASYVVEDADITIASEIKPENKVAEQKKDNTRIFQEDNQVVKNELVLLSVSDVQILTKFNPADVQVKNSKNRQPYAIGNKKNTKASYYSLEDVPTYPGGDQALQDYFRGKLQPIQIKQNNDKYDRSVVIDLEIAASGKLKDYKIYGQLYPEHHKALIKAIQELPKFQKGTESVSYSIGVAF